MKKTFGLMLVPVMLASLPMLGFSEKMSPEPARMVTPNRTQQQMGQPAMSQPTMSQSQVGRPVAGTMGRQNVNNLSPEQIRLVQEWFSRGQWQLVDKSYGEAITTFEKVLQLNPQHIRSLNELATAQMFNSQHEEALETINRALALDPVNTKLFFTKARILDAQNNEAEALDYYLTFAALDPTDTSVLTAQRRADELFKRWEGRFSEPQKLYFTGLRFLSMEQPDKALPLLEKYSQIEPGSINGHFLLGWGYFQLNQPEKAITYFENITRKQPENPMAYFHLGETYIKAGKVDSAKAAWSNFIKFAPHSAEVGILDRKIIVQSDR